MKKLIVAISMMFIVANVSAQVVYEADVPSAVTAKMHQMFPAATTVVWTKDMPGFITSDFIQNKTKMSATFSTSGSWVSTERYMKQDSLPAAINQYLMTTYNDGKVSQCAISESVKQKTYECRVKSKTAGEYDLVFDMNGNLLLKSVVEKE